MAVILFLDLDDLTAELLALGAGAHLTGHVVRVEGIHQLRVNENTPALVNTSAEVHVRTIYHGDVLIWCYEVAEIQVIRGHGDTGEPKPAELELSAKLERVVGHVRRYLESLSFDVRAGLIDITPATPIAGTWAGFDKWIKAEADASNAAKGKGATHGPA